MARAILLALFFFFSSSSLYAEATYRKVVIVLDASGSMWGQIDGEAKISIAKRVVKEFIRDWDDSSPIGLTVYGHRSKGDCDDIEAVVPLGKLNLDKFNSVLSGLSAKGMTPLSQAVRQAAEELRYQEEEATVILVSDGIETCKQDPCAMARELEEAGVNFTAHVIGFDLSEKDQKQLVCIAENTGGKFLAAKDSASLKDSLSEVVKVAVVKEIEAPKVGVSLKAVIAQGGDALDVDSWAVFPEADAPTEKPSAIAHSYDDTPVFYLEPGKYLVSVKQDKVEAEKAIEILAGKLINEEVVISDQGQLELVAVTEPGGTPLEVRQWEVFTTGQDGNSKRQLVESSYNKIPLLTLLPGRYLVRVEKDKASAEKEVEIVANRMAKEELLVSEQGRIELVAVTEPGGKPLETHHWQVLSAEEDENGKREQIEHTYDDTPTLTLLPGRYLVKVQKDKAEAEKEIEIVAGKTVREEVILAQQGRLQLVAVTEAGGKPLETHHWQVLSAEDDENGKREQIEYTYEDTPTLTLLPGRYLVSVQKEKATAQKEVEVVAGKTVKEELILARQGRLELVAVTEVGGKPLETHHWQVLSAEEDEAGKREQIEYTYDDTPTLTLLPGRYLVKVQKEKAWSEKYVEVIPDKKIREEILLAKQGVLKLSAVVDGSVIKPHHWEVLSGEENEDGKRELIEHTYESTPRITLLPGRYLIKVQSKAELWAEKEIHVIAGEVSDEKIVLH